MVATVAIERSSSQAVNSAWHPMVWLVLAAFVAVFAVYDLATGHYLAAAVIAAVGAAAAAYGLRQRDR
jgi:hypothetical protein